MLRRTEGSSKEEQIYQKEQILAELQVGVVVTLMMLSFHFHHSVKTTEVNIPMSQTSLHLIT